MIIIGTVNINYNFTNIDKLNNDLTKKDWSEVLKTTDVNIAMDLFTNIVENCVKKLRKHF